MAITRFTVDDSVIDTRMNQMVDEADSAIGQKADKSSFTPTSQPLVVGSGFEAQTGTSPFQVTKSGQMFYFIGQIKCLVANATQPAFLAVSPIKPEGYFVLAGTLNGVIRNFTIDPQGNIYDYKTFAVNDVITFNGFALGVL